MHKITIEASNIYFRGGFVLLEQLLDYCEENTLPAKVYLGYEEVYLYFVRRNYQFITLMQTNGISTLIRYSRKRNNILFFCNLPPFVKSKSSALYVHNPFFIHSYKPIKGETVIFNLKKFLYFYWIKLFSRKVDVVACQTVAVQKLLHENLGVKSELFPFYKNENSLDCIKEYEFCYMGSGAQHKNNKRLLDAVDQLSEKHHFKIVMTIEENENNIDIISTIKRINKKFSRDVLINKGLVAYDEVVKIYSSSEALIFPSLAETLGLPLIEALQFGLKVLSSDLPYTYQVVENPIVFNPESVEDIMSVMENQLNGEYRNVIQKNKIPNKLPELIEVLK